MLFTRQKEVLIVKHLPATLEVIRLEIDYLATCLRLFAELLIKMPGCSTQAQDHFIEYRTHYLSQHGDYEQSIKKAKTGIVFLPSAVTAVETQLKNSIAVNEQLSAYLQTVLEASLKTVIDSLEKPFRSVLDHFKELATWMTNTRLSVQENTGIPIQPALSFESFDMKPRIPTQVDTTLKQSLEQATQYLSQHLLCLEKKAAPFLSRQKSLEAWGSQQVGKALFREAQLILKQIDAFKYALRNFRSASFLSTNPVVSEETGATFVFYAWVLKHSAIVSALKCKAHDYQKCYEAQLRCTQKLKARLGSDYAESLRIQRILAVYQAWAQQLSQYLNKEDCSDRSFSQALQIQYYLSYCKKDFLKKSLQEQRVHTIQEQLSHRLEESPLQTPAELLCALQAEKKKLILDNAEKQHRLQSGFSVGYRGLATIVLGWQQQGPYQMGRLSSESLSRGLEHYPIPVLQEHLPPSLQHKLNEAVGSTFMLISLSLSHWLGYSYQSAFALSHVLLAQQDTLNAIGNHIDHSFQSLEQYYSRVCPQAPLLSESYSEALQQMNRWDEIGLIEKEAFLYWLSGLMVHCGFQMRAPWAPVVSAYSAATLVATLAAKSTEQLAYQLSFSSSTQQLLKALAHLWGYSYGYQYGLGAAAHLKSSSSEISSTQALQLFGFERYVSERSLKERYHQLALQKHPDRCKEADCLVAMQQLNAAYQVLRKKVQ